MKRLKQLNSVVQEYNGLLARFNRTKEEDDKVLLDGCLLKLKTAVDEVLNDQA